MLSCRVLLSVAFPAHLAGAAQFCNVNLANLCATADAQINGNLNVDGIITGQDGLGYGNTLIVDAVNGNDATGAVNGPRYKTIAAACAQATAGDLVLVYPGVYNESITVPPFVTVSGNAPGNVIIQQLNVTAPTDLVILQTGANLANVSLVLTSTMHVRLCGLVFPPSSINQLLSSQAFTVGIIVDNSGAGAGSSDVYGVAFSGPGSTTPTNNGLGQTIVTSSILVTSTGLGKKRGALVDTENALNIFATRILVSGGTHVIGVETDTNAIASLITSLVSGSTADISKTVGDLNLLATSLINSTANSLGFETLVKPTAFIFVDPNTPIGAGFTLYLRPGTFDAALVPITIPAAQSYLAKSITVRAIVPPGSGESAQFIVQKNGVDTILSVTLSDNQTDANQQGLSVTFEALENLSVKLVNSAGSNLSDVLVSINVY